MSTSHAEWPHGARAAIVITFDNMGEAADIDRGVWPENEPIGNHYSVTSVLPKFLAILDKYDVKATYFIESWNFNVYQDAIAKQLADAGHEIGWHAWRHETWSKLKEEDVERANFTRSFGPDGLEGFKARASVDEGATTIYKGFRPPGGVTHGERTFKLCKQYGIQYVSPAGRDAAVVKFNQGKDSIVILPFRWSTVDAYYYHEAFSRLRRIKNEPSVEPQSAAVLEQRYIAQIDSAIAEGGYLSLLFHPCLTEQQEQLQAFENVVRYLAAKRSHGDIWLARCCDVTEWIKGHPSIVGSDPVFDDTPFM